MKKISIVQHYQCLSCLVYIVPIYKIIAAGSTIMVLFNQEISIVEHYHGIDYSNILL